ncbi:hypothetical protein HN014_06480 [Aquimarina sp. TRL1]|uniref:XAC2610-related protein n=1 Tax=Aquimarina sp. (strain TRL1) TaxID=2736252 RepID=UPI00158D5931|nr:hypothetical protein [Aquimarina sp. TRL1]QKX04572.1 hypothetical protein HN014_06480 [Aquimarina sp. TRL1]
MEQLRIGVIFWFLSLSVIGQTTYLINDFSDVYKGKLIIDQGYEEEVFKKGTVIILEKLSEKEVVAISSEELTFSLNEEGEVETGVVSLPYGEQSIIISEDVNFDGVKDIVVMDGQYSCYHGPSYQVYLHREGQLIHSPSFTRLAQEYCGMFQTNNETKTIETMTKSGCCWHQFSQFEVVNNVPVPIEVVEEEYQYLYHITRTKTWRGGRAIEKTERRMNKEGVAIEVLMSFRLSKNQKKVLLFTSEGRLNYVLLKSEGELVEFSFPADNLIDAGRFAIDTSKSKLIFKNKEAIYEIYEKRKQDKVMAVGIYVYVNGKKYHLSGDLSTLQGAMQGISSEKLVNVDG